MISTVKQLTLGLTVILVVTYILLGTRLQYDHDLIQRDVVKVKALLTLYSTGRSNDTKTEAKHQTVVGSASEAEEGERAQVLLGEDPGANAAADHGGMQHGQQEQPKPAQQGSGAVVAASSAAASKAEDRPGSAGAEQQGAAAEDSVKIIDLFIYNGEPIVELRLQYLAAAVDEIVVVESRLTFSGRSKPQLFIERDAHLFQQYQHVTALIIDSYPEPDEAWLARQQAAGRTWMEDTTVWFRETYQRNFAGPYIRSKYAGQRYVVLASDVDEIPSQATVLGLRDFGYEHAHVPISLEMEFSYYNFNWTAQHLWYHAFAVNDVGLAANITLDEYRMDRQRLQIRHRAGWHMSYYMGVAELARKVESFSHREYDTLAVKAADHIRLCIHTGRDLFNRGPAFDMRIAGAHLQASRPTGWQGFAKRLAQMQEL